MLLFMLSLLIFRRPCWHNSVIVCWNLCTMLRYHFLDNLIMMFCRSLTHTSLVLGHQYLGQRPHHQQSWAVLGLQIRGWPSLPPNPTLNLPSQLHLEPQPPAPHFLLRLGMSLAHHQWAACLLSAKDLIQTLCNADHCSWHRFFCFFVFLQYRISSTSALCAQSYGAPNSDLLNPDNPKKHTTNQQTMHRRTDSAHHAEQHSKPWDRSYIPCHIECRASSSLRSVQGVCNLHLLAT